MANIPTISECFIEQVATILVAHLTPSQVTGVVGAIRVVESLKTNSMNGVPVLLECFEDTTVEERKLEMAQLRKERDEFKLLIDALNGEAHESELARHARMYKREQAWRERLTSLRSQEKSRRDGNGAVVAKEE